jgi:hypothetical protein
MTGGTVSVRALNQAIPQRQMATQSLGPGARRCTCDAGVHPLHRHIDNKHQQQQEAL